jgi:hypothetical protein
MAQITLNSSGVASNGSLLLQSNGTTTAVTVDTAQNVGVGVTPSAWVGSTALQVGPSGSVAGNSSLPLIISANAYGTTAGFAAKYITSNYATIYLQYQGEHRWNTAPSGTAGNTISANQAMTLDASGNLLTGLTSARGSNKLQVLGSMTAYTSAGISLFCGNGANNLGSSGPRADINVLLSNNWKTNLQFLVNTTDSDVAPIEAGRFDSSGNLLVGATSNSATAARLYVLANGTNATAELNVPSTASYTQIGFRNPNGVVGSIATSGSATSYNTSSDYRLKNAVEPMTGALAKVIALKPCTYKWKVDGADGEGFIAHELAEVVPNCVTGEKDAVDADGNPVYQGIDTSFLVATLTAAIQEQQALITQLQADVAALKGASA